MRTDKSLKVVVLEIAAFREILAAFKGNKDLDKISKILKDFSKDLLIYFKSADTIVKYSPLFHIMKRFKLTNIYKKNNK